MNDGANGSLPQIATQWRNAVRHTGIPAFAVASARKRTGSRACWSRLGRVGPGTLRPVRSKDYGDDVLAGDWRRPRKGQIPEIAAEPGLVAEDPSSGFCGAVVACAKDAVTLEDRFGKRRVFPLAKAGFLIDGKPVTLVRPTSAPGRALSASGSVAVRDLRARVARESRIYVEGKHDAELVEKIWGHDLRVEGVVVEFLEGVDHLPEIAEEFGPGPGRRLGVLVDHLVTGSKESRIADQVASPYVLVTGHPFIDIWQAVKPAALGIRAWPDVPRGVPWKEGVIAALGWKGEPGEVWQTILGRVRSYTDLEPALLGRVEELIDFVTDPSADD
ncbi:DUF3097 domain-containing protein [Actinoallomurus oryzae]|uniref:DUF3097 domain-containing protein n=1 Tax=Actinoallomurus oryzae TaxID=502180 RepID=A0ABP8PUL1_9ACTN